MGREGASWFDFVPAMAPDSDFSLALTPGFGKH